MHDVQRGKPGIQPHKQSGDNGKVFSYVVCDAESGQAAPGHQKLFADANDIDQLGGRRVRSTMFPASLAAWVPEFMATATSAWANAGASLVPSPS